MEGLVHRRGLKALAASAAAIAACIIIVAPLIAGGASAGPQNRADPAARGQCPDTLCVFTAEDFGGTRVDVTKLGVSNKVDNQIPGQAQALINDRQTGAFFYRGRDARGRAICINSGDFLNALNQVQLTGLRSTRLLDRNCPRR